MKVLICQLIYGERPHNILIDNELNAGYSATYVNIDTEGIANALNEGISYMIENDFDAIGFLANDIAEPQNWLLKKVQALQSYPLAGIVASSLDHLRTQVQSELIISNWLISRDTINRIGFFNESMFPYGPIDLDYCQRCFAAGIRTYYVMDCLAVHDQTHYKGPKEYGWDKESLVSIHEAQHQLDVPNYRSGVKPIYIGKKTSDGK